jgi:hypothetical protein
MYERHTQHTALIIIQYVTAASISTSILRMCFDRTVSRLLAVCAVLCKSAVQMITARNMKTDARVHTTLTNEDNWSDHLRFDDLTAHTLLLLLKCTRLPLESVAHHQCFGSAISYSYSLYHCCPYCTITTTTTATCYCYCYHVHYCYYHHYSSTPHCTNTVLGHE